MLSHRKFLGSPPRFPSSGWKATAGHGANISPGTFLPCNSFHFYLASKVASVHVLIPAGVEIFQYKNHIHETARSWAWTGKAAGGKCLQALPTEVAFPELCRTQAIPQLLPRSVELRESCPSKSQLWQCCLVGKCLTSVWLQHLQACKASQGAAQSISGNCSMERQDNLTVLPNGKEL